MRSWSSAERLALGFSIYGASFALFCLIGKAGYIPVGAWVWAAGMIAGTEVCTYGEPL